MILIFLACQALPAEVAQRRNPLPAMKRLRRVAYGSVSWVVVGARGSVITSRDGIAWTMQNSGSTATLEGLLFANGWFVAVGTEGILVSTSGVNWVRPRGGTGRSLHGVAYGGGRWTAAGAGGGLFTSTNGIEWTVRKAIASNSSSLQGVAPRTLLPFVFIQPNVDSRLVQPENRGNSEKTLAAINCTKGTLLQAWCLLTAENEAEESHGGMRSRFVKLQRTAIGWESAPSTSGGWSKVSFRLHLLSGSGLISAALFGIIGSVRALGLVQLLKAHKVPYPDIQAVASEVAMHDPQGDFLQKWPAQA